MFRRRLAACIIGIFALCLLAATASAQSTLVFDRIVIEGNQRIEDSTVENFAQISPGQPVSLGQINGALQRLQGSGLFETVETIPDGNRLIIRVKELPTVNEIAIEGNARLDDEVLLPIVRSQPRRVFSPTQVEEDARAIAEAYRLSGRLAATVIPRIIPRSQNRVDIVFEVTEGATVEVERIGFVGNDAYSNRRLRQVLGTKQAGIFRSVVSRDNFVEDRIAFDRQVLTDFYRARGFVDFEVLSVSTEFSQDRNAFFITFNVREGLQFRFGEVTVESEIGDLDPAAYAAIPRTRTGQVYSPVRVDDGISRLERQLLTEARDFVRVEPRITRNERVQTLDIAYTFVRGQRAFVERIDISGNSTTRDDVIRRQFETVEGDPFNPRAIRQASDRIRALGFFSLAEVETRPGTSDDRVIVDVQVEEQPTGNIGFGLNFSVGDGLGGTFNLTERNFLGRGQTLRFGLAGGPDNAAANISFVEPALLGRDVRGRFDIFYSQTDNFNTDYNTREIGFSPSLGFRLSEYTRLSVRYRLADETLSDVDRGEPGTTDNGSSAIIQREEGSRLTSSVGYSLSYDTRRVGLDPNSGVRLELGQDFAGVGGENQYIRTTATARGETKAFAEEVGLSLELQGGALTMLGGETSTVLDRFTAGRRVRGFARNGIGPRDLAATNEDALGGEYYAVLRAEADFPLGLPEELGVRGGVFYDAGSIWGLDDTAGTGGEIDDSFSLRSVVGVSIFWTTAIGPLRFDFTRALQKESFDEEQQFDFSISTGF